jgi:thiamine-monophosphate kinase
MSRTEINSLGEFGLIDRLAENVTIRNTSTVKGIGDDAAIILNEREVTVVSTDILTEGIHFDLSYTPLMHLGYKAVVVNLSDIYAMNATPAQITVSIAISNRFSVEAIEEIYKGINLACEFYKVDLVGGDTTSSLKGLFLSITAIGQANQDKIVRRAGAKPGDLICVSGDLGAAYLGLQLLNREKQVFLEDPNMQPQLNDKQYLVGRFLKPEARKDIIEFLVGESILPTSMIDISDGLSSELHHLCRQSSTGALIEENAIPIAEMTYHTSVEFNINPTVCALSGGEDYELLFTVNPKELQKIENAPVDIRIIGEIKEAKEGINIMSKAGTITPINALGWNSFKQV